MIQARSRRFPRRAQTTIFVACLLSLLVPLAAVSASSPVSPPAPEVTRFVAEVDRKVAFEVSSLTNPNRVVIELPDVALQLPQAPQGKAVGLIQDFRGGLAAPGRFKIVIDVTQPVIIVDKRLEKSLSGKSQRLVVEFTAAPSQKEAQRKGLPQPMYATGPGGLQPPLPRKAMSPKARAAQAYKPIIVIDPGHGGHDSGAQRHGTVEKDVVLAFGKLLRDKIAATGRYTVLMTRSDDTFVDLDERLAFAERNKASLFIAVHADYASTGARGATVYSLRDNVADQLKRSAKGDAAVHALSGRELEAVKASSAADVDTVRRFLADLAQREVDTTKERTKVFTGSVIEFMGQSTSLKDNPDREANFRVLMTAQFPSVLIELAYVSNKADAELLRSQQWREKVSRSIVSAVDNYFSHEMVRLPL